MKKHHILLVIIIVGIAAFFLKEARNLQNRESSASGELKLLREAAKRSPGAATSSSLSGRSPGSRPPVIDPEKFMADLSDILQSGPGAESRERMNEIAEKYEKQLASAPVSKLKEICELLEKDFPLDQVGSEMARRIWLGLLGMAAKSDPAWAIAKLDQAASTTEVPIEAVLDNFKRWAGQNGESMSPSYAGALQKWLDSAQADGRIEPNNPLVSELRSAIAVARGDQTAAVQQISQLPYARQKKAAVEHVASLQTPAAQRQALEELSMALHVQIFPHFVRELADQQGFDAAREILDSASLTAEKHDMAAAGIAAAKIGPETKNHAEWLLEKLRTDDHRALEEFTGTWTEGNYADAANWITSLPNGKQRDAALKGFVPVAARIDGATAMDWALTVSDPLMRNRLYCEAHENWKKTDAEQAEAYRKEKPLDMEAVMSASKPQNPSE